MKPRFLRLSAPGAAALSCWRLESSDCERERLFGPAAAGRPRRLRVGPPAAPFDEGLLLVERGEAELHLHGGEGVARALRSWLGSEDWEERAPQAAPSGAPRWPEAAEAQQRFFHADSPLAARAWCAFAARGAAPGCWSELCALAAPQRAETARSWLRGAEWARLLERPPAIAIAGPANAGKSSLFNAWLGSPRATVADAPGTTRDPIGERLRLGAGEDAWEVRLLDTAGLWEDAAGVDAAAGMRAEAVLAGAWRRLWVFDAAAAPDPRAVRAYVRHAQPADLRLLARCDLGVVWEPERVLGGAWTRGSLRAEGGELPRRLAAALQAQPGPSPAAEEPFPFGEELRERLRAVARAGG